MAITIYERSIKDKAYKQKAELSAPAKTEVTSPLDRCQLFLRILKKLYHYNDERDDDEFQEGEIKLSMFGKQTTSQIKSE